MFIGLNIPSYFIVLLLLLLFYYNKSNTVLANKINVRFVFFSSGTGADSSMEICAMEEMELICPPRDLAIQRNEYQSLLWSVSDLDSPNTKHEYVLYCGENPVSCKRYSLKTFAKQISVRKPVGGKVYLKHLNMHKRLSYTCKVELKDDKPPLAYQVNVSSSVYCKCKLMDCLFDCFL